MKLTLLIILLLVFNSKGYSQNLAPYLDSIFNLVLENRLVAFDSNKSPIPYQTIINKYQYYDTIINDLWTRPKFINNIYHSPFDGVISKKSRPDFDTSFHKSEAKFISFIEKVYDDNGNYVHKKWAFMININSVPLSLNSLNKLILKEIKPKKNLSTIAKILQTKKNETWVNESFKINGSPYPIDSCMSKYSLHLNSNSKFEHNYFKDSFCITSSCFYEKNVGIEGDTGDFLKYSKSIQYYKIENQCGYWSVEKSDLNDIFLLFYSKNGYILAKYKLQNISKNYLVLHIKNQEISLRKVIQKK